MFFFTKQERAVFIALISVIFAGSLCEFAAKRLGGFARHFQLVERTKNYFTVNINTATREELIKIPYIGEYTAKQIIGYRENKGRFKDLEELKKVKGIRDKNFEKFAPFLKI